MAVSADHRELAMAVRVTGSPGGACDRVQLWVVDLRDGHRRVWLLPHTVPSPALPGGYFVEDLAWDPGGRRLALHYGQCCADAGGVWILDPTSPQGALLDRLRRVPAHVSCQTPVQAWSRAGLVGSDDVGCAGERAQLVAIDPTSGQERPLPMAWVPSPIEQISADPTGSHLLVLAADAVYRDDQGAARAVRLMALPWDPQSPPEIAW